MMNTNAAPVAKLAISERIALPVTIKRCEAKNLISALFGNPASAFGAASATARRDDFVSKCAALALASMVHGDSSRLERIERYAATLPEYKKSKGGEISGSIGKLILAYREAVNVGDKARLHADFDTNAEVIDLGRWLINSASFGGIVEAPKRQAKPIEKKSNGGADTAPTDTAATDTAATYTAPSLLVSYNDGSINHDADPQAEIAANLAQDKRIAHAAAIEKARQEGEQAVLRRMVAQGEDATKRTHAFCQLANDLGIVLTKAQLAQLDKLCKVIKVA